MSPPRTRRSERSRRLQNTEKPAVPHRSLRNEHISPHSEPGGTNSPIGFNSQSGDQDVDEDDLCPVCQLLLCHPVITQCNHVLCKSCMATWADVSLASLMTIVSVEEQPREFDAATGLEARCPMCRTQTTASVDETRERILREKYPAIYTERESEEAQLDSAQDSIQTITVYIGNRHKLIEPPSPPQNSENVHDWTFFVRPSRTDIIEEVQIFLHPTFRRNRVFRTRPPYEVQGLGWGYFTITAGVILKAGYRWVSSDAEDSPDGAPQGLLRLEWTLDFSSFGGSGAMGRCRLKVKNDRDWVNISDEEERDTAEWNRMVRSYNEDGRYEPPSPS